MNLLLSDPPTSIIDVDGTLYFDTDELSIEDNLYCGECLSYPLVTDFRNVLDIMIMFESEKLTDREKALCTLRMMYKDDIPEDIMQAYSKTVTFLNCGDEFQEKSDKKKKVDRYGRLYSWKQDGGYIYTAINYSHNDILKRKPNLHWWEFISCFMQLKEDCRFNEIVNNRLAHKKNKATKEQKEARNEYPEIYILKDSHKLPDKVLEEALMWQEKLNAGGCKEEIPNKW